MAHDGFPGRRLLIAETTGNWTGSDGTGTGQVNTRTAVFAFDCPSPCSRRPVSPARLVVGGYYAIRYIFSYI